MQHHFASWGARLVAWLLDGLFNVLVVAIPVGLGLFLALKDANTDPVTGETTGLAGGWFVLVALGGLLGIGFYVWNRGIRQGNTGQSLGKQVLNIKVVGKDTGAVIGTGSGLLRMVLDYIFGNACFLNYLWPLWDQNKQTWHDMVVKSVVVRA